MGKSFGAAVAAYMVSELKTRDGSQAQDLFTGLILESAFTSCEDLYTEKFKGWVPKTFYSDNKWPTADRIPKVHLKTLIIHGAEDEVVPVSHAYQLLERRPDAELLIVQQAGHN